MSAGKRRLYLLPFLQNIQIYREILTSYLKIFILRIHELLQGQMHPRMSVTVSANAPWATVVLHMLATLVQMHCGCLGNKFVSSVLCSSLCACRVWREYGHHWGLFIYVAQWATVVPCLSTKFWSAPFPAKIIANSFCGIGSPVDLGWG